MLHFQFRTFPYGAEQLNYAIVDMDGIPRRRYREMQETAGVMKKLSPLARAEFPKEVAICIDYDALWAHKIKPVNNQAFDYLAFAEKQYHVLSSIGINADVVSIYDDWQNYKMVVLPALIITSDDTQKKIKQFVYQGGVVISSFLLSVKNTDNVGYTKSLPAGLTEVFGITVEEVEPVFPYSVAHIELTANHNKLVSCDDIWSELLKGKAEPRGVYEDSFKKGQSVVSKNYYGRGHAWYVGSNLSDEAWLALYEEASSDANIHPLRINAPQNVEIVRRKIDGKDCLFLFNFDNNPHQLELPVTMTEYITGLQYHEVTLAGNGFMVLLSL
jgi:beta-galactosidase